jgi:polyhydroxyalkanoate synthesis regulator protein
MSGSSKPVLVKRYARNRLYDATHGACVSVEQLREWVRKSVQFTVVDVETGDDVTLVLLGLTAGLASPHLALAHACSTPL